jgi:hypothetical protein
MAFNPKEWLLTIGAIAGIGAGIVEVAQYVTSASTKLTATYDSAPFTLPLRLQERGALDSAIVEIHQSASRLYYAYRDHLTLAERAAGIPDSLKRPDMPRAYFFGNKVEPFARDYNTFGTLHIQNEGDKALGPLQVLHGKAAYYEFKDSNGRLQSGESESRFSVGELVAGESRDVKLWGDRNYNNTTLTITYSDGKIQTPRTEIVTGWLAWLAQNSSMLTFPLFFLAAYAILFGFYYIYTRAQGQRRVAQSAEQLNKLLDPDK